jgi:tRNA nucleotidyltransferase/poly(A) polymerase
MDNFAYMDTRKVIKKLSSDRYNREVFGYVESAYLVGGFIRDVMIGRKAMDRDYVVEQDPFDVASMISRDVGGRVVTFKDESTVRIALEGGITLDFSKMKKTIEHDLLTRDFTINSIAYNPQYGLLDPYGGCHDIQKGKIRTARKSNIFDDPLRCLRAYRMKSEFDWEIDGELREVTGQAKEGLLQISPERITLEFFKMMNGKHCYSALEECLKEGVLDIIISQEINMIRPNIEKILEIDGFIEKLPSKETKMYNEIFSHNLTHNGMVRLERLLYGAEMDKVRLSFSRQIMKRLLKAGKFLDELRYSPGRLDIFDAFFSSKDMIYDLVCLSGRKELIQDARRFISISRNKMLSSSDVMDIINIRGESFGYILYCLDREIYYRRIKTKEQARNYIRNFEI